MHISIPEKVNTILRTLHDAGFEAYIVGGCVRDAVLGRQPQDWDVTTSAKPEEVKALFGRTVDTGLQHGTVTVLLGHGADREGFEVTTYRVDGIYADARHPEQVTFTSRLSEDLLRRDFTMNAMAYNDDDGLVDLFGGMEDLKARRIRAVGVPRERFGEDALRILRAVRFAAQLDYSIEEETASAIRAMAGNLTRISAERIRTELEKLIVSDHPGHLELARELGITAVILPEFDRCVATPQNNPYHCYNVGEHILRAMEASAPDRVLRLSLLLHDMGKPLCRTTDEQGIDHFYRHGEESARLAGDILRRLKYDNDTRDKVLLLVRRHDEALGDTTTAMRRSVARLCGDKWDSDEILPLLFAIHRADAAAQAPEKWEQHEVAIRKEEALYRQIREAGNALRLRDLAVSGSDLIALGWKPGPDIGACLQAMLDDVLETPAHNTREYLLAKYAQAPS